MSASLIANFNARAGLIAFCCGALIVSLLRPFNKLGMWIFLLSDAFSFSGLLITYGVLRAAAPRWWPPGSWPTSRCTTSPAPGTTVRRVPGRAAR